MNTNKYLFEDAPIPKAVATMAIPTMISMLVVVIYNMADTFFIGQTGDPMQVAAVSLATPVFMVFTGKAALFLLLLRFLRARYHYGRRIPHWHEFYSENDRRQRKYH